MNIHEIKPFIRFAREIFLNKSTNISLTYDHRLFYVLEGNCNIRIENSRFDIREGSVLLIQSGTEYVFNISKPVKLAALNFDYTQNHSGMSKFISPVKPDSFNRNNILEEVWFADAPALNSPIVILNIYNIKHSLERIIEEHKKCLLYSNEISSALLNEIIIQILRFTITSSAGTYDKITGVIKYIEENYSKDISNDELAKISGYHPYHLNRLMKEYTNTTVHKYLMSYRIKKSAEYLLNSDLSISEISDICGFNSPYYYSNLFKEEIGISPLNFRRLQKNRI